MAEVIGAHFTTVQDLEAGSNTKISVWVRYVLAIGRAPHLEQIPPPPAGHR